MSKNMDVFLLLVNQSELLRLHVRVFYDKKIVKNVPCPEIEQLMAGQDTHQLYI